MAGGADSQQLFIGKFTGAHRIRPHARQLASRQTSAIFRVNPCTSNIHGHFLSSFSINTDRRRRDGTATSDAHGRFQNQNGRNSAWIGQAQQSVTDTRQAHH
jgi:hypothetical protein